MAERNIDQDQYNYEFENRITKLESWKESMQAEIVVRLCDQVCHRISMNVASHLPKVGALIQDFNKLKFEFDEKVKSDEANLQEMIEKGNNSFEIFKQMRFTVNTMGADVDFYKRIFNNDRIAKMNKQDKEIEYVENECRNLKEKIENTCTRE